jgi:glycerophosphoryl diester phosphodiesterase
MATFAHAPRPRPLVWAHRGACKERPENTLAAFRLAEEQGADGVELDVMRCRSGEVVVFHDDDLSRLAGRPERVRDLGLEELRRARVGGEPIPTLEEVLHALRPSTLVNIELKAPERRGAAHLRELVDDGLAAEVARLVARAGADERALVSSFHPLLLLRLRLAAPALATGLLFHGELGLPLRRAWAASLLRTTALHPEAPLVTARRVRAWQAEGRAVNVWTVDDPAVVRFLAAVGVDGIITNVVTRTRSVLDGAAPPAAAAAARGAV